MDSILKEDIIQKVISFTKTHIYSLTYTGTNEWTKKVKGKALFN
jgi:hypothetical protein